jgi:hypothetical protein
MTLVRAAKAAGVKRFVPCGFITIAPPKGVMFLRDEVGRFMEDIWYTEYIAKFANRKKKSITRLRELDYLIRLSTSDTGIRSHSRLCHLERPTMQ